MRKTHPSFRWVVVALSASVLAGCHVRRVVRAQAMALAWPRTQRPALWWMVWVQVQVRLCGADP
jgi:hypothetical protein